MTICQNPTCLFDTGFCDGTLCLETKEERQEAIFYAVMAAENEHCDDCGEPLYLLPDWPKDKLHDCGLASALHLKGRKSF